jgi:hypothetical protein
MRGDLEHACAHFERGLAYRTTAEDRVAAAAGGGADR